MANTPQQAPTTVSHKVNNMCRGTEPSTKSKKKSSTTKISSSLTAKKPVVVTSRRRRRKRDREGTFSPPPTTQTKTTTTTTLIKKKKSKSLEKHGDDKKSGGMEALIPSFIGLAILVPSLMAQMGFRGRAGVAGIDLGTTNSVICVQAPSKSVGEIECISDPLSNSPIIPSVVSFLEPSERISMTSKKDREKKSDLQPLHPSHVVVGSIAKRRIDSHPHHTLYNAKRVLGRTHDHDAVSELRQQVEFDIIHDNDEQEEESDNDDGVLFRVSHHDPTSSSNVVTLKPEHVGSYIVNHLIQITNSYLGHENVKSAVIAVPAKFDSKQRQQTAEAFKNAGVKVARMLEEPQAAALAYGLHRKENVNYILVYDFGGGTLDVSVLQVSDGFVDVMGSDGDDRLGGADFDGRVAHFLLDERGGNKVVERVSTILKRIETELLKTDDDALKDIDLEDLLSESCPALQQVPLCSVSSFHTIGEQMKIGLSSYPDGGGVVKAECLTVPEPSKSSPTTVDDFCKSLEPFALSLTSKEYEKAVSDLFERSVLPIRRIIADLGLKKNEIDEVVMVGGTTRMPQIRRLVQKELNVESLNTSIDPDLTVAYGAASVID